MTAQPELPAQPTPMPLGVRLGRAAYRATVGTERRVYRLRPGHLEIEGTPVHHLSGGRPGAPTVVLLHGFSASTVVWLRFAHRLTDRYRVLIVDLPGHGDSPYLPGVGHTGPDHARRTWALLDRLGIARAHVVGNSMGGFIAAHMATQAPSRMLSLGLFDPAGVHSPQPSAMEELLRGGTNRFLCEQPSDFDLLYPMTMARPPFNPPPARRAMGFDYVARRPALAQMWEEFWEQHWFDPHQLAQISVPARVVWGAEDQLLDVSAAAVWGAGLADAEVVVHPGIGHMPMLEIPRQTAREHLQFLDRTQHLADHGAHRAGDAS